jgi:hypothetical protein
MHKIVIPNTHIRPKNAWFGISDAFLIIESRIMIAVKNAAVVIAG